MKKFLKYIFLLIATACLSIGCACNNTQEDSTSQGNQVEQTVYFETTEYTLKVGESINLELQGASKNTNIIWSSTNKSVASVENGEVKALLVGTAEIRAITNEGEAVCKVTVIFNESVEDNSNAVYSVRLNQTQLELCPETVAVLEATVYKDCALAMDVVEWGISDSSAVQATSEGNVLTVVGAGIGNTTITAKIGKATAVCQISVNNVTDIVLSETSGVFTIGDEPYQINSNVYLNGQLQAAATLEWHSENESVASVDVNGVVTPISKGETTIKGVFQGKEVSYAVKVMQIVEINSKQAFLNLGKEYTEEETKYLIYELTTDLSFSEADFTPDKNMGVSVPQGAYLVETLNGVFDGKGHTITTSYDKNNAYLIFNETAAFPAIFRTIAENATLKNVKIVAHTITNYEASSVARWNYGIVEDCYIEATHFYQHWLEDMWLELLACYTGEIVYNYGTVRNCVFKVFAGDYTGAVAINSFAVRLNLEGATMSNCTMIGNTTGQFISSQDGGWWSCYVAGAAGNTDQNRTNCYVFANKEALLKGDGGEYRTNGTIKAGTYTDVKNLYTGEYWDAWLK